MFSPAPSRTAGTKPRTWSPPTCRSTCPSCSSRRRRRLASRSCPGRELAAAVPPASTFGRASDGGEFPSRPGRSRQRCYLRPTPLFHPLEFPTGLVVRRLVPLSLHRVLGPLHRKPFGVHDPSQLVVAERNLRCLGQMGVEPGQRPDAEAVSQ